MLTIYSVHIGFNAKISVNNETTNNEEIARLANGKYLHLYGYVNNLKLFLPYLDELKNHIFRIKKFHLISAKEKLRSIIGWGQESVTTFVSIHVRMGDYNDLLHGIPEAATSSYFTRAMEYFTRKYLVII